MSLEAKSQELKNIIATYDTQWLLGGLAKLIHAAANNRAQDQLAQLSSPMRQLFFLGGLLITSDDSSAEEIQFTYEKWNDIVGLLNEIEDEYDKLFFLQPDEEIDEEWMKVKKVAMPSFLNYFNQGPMNFEEQVINWIKDLYGPLDDIIKKETGLSIDDFIHFYFNIENLVQSNFRGFASPKGVLRPNWQSYTRISMGVVPEAPDFIREMGEKDRPLYTFMADYGLINRFYPDDVVSQYLSVDRVNAILQLLTCRREESNFLYYTATKPGNPLYDKPIVDIGEGMYQVFDVKQIAHALENLFESVCSKSSNTKARLVDRKGKLLEQRIVDLFKAFFRKDFKYYVGYYVDGCEQDILFLWRDYVFIIEAKGYNLREPLRDPKRAFVRIKDDFKACIGYGYTQTKRVAQKFIDKVPLEIKDKDGNVIEVIDTSKYENNDFSIIVNLKSFGQIQSDLSTLLEVDEDDTFPWAVKLDDLEAFLLTLVARKKKPIYFINYLLMREDLHGKLYCSDEMEVCGGYLTGKITEDVVESAEAVITTPDLAQVFDDQYYKGLGLKNEKYLKEKKGGKTIFW